MLGHGPVALAAFEWSGKWRQDWILRWQMIETQADLDRAIATIGGSVRGESRYPTALGYALARASQAFRRAPPCDTRTLDVSGDGESNDGFAPAHVYATYPFDDIGVNALVIGRDPGLVQYFQTEVIRGPFAFVEVAQDFEDFERAMRRKLERELTPRVVGAAE